MPRTPSLWRPMLAASSLALLAACAVPPAEQSSYVAPQPTAEPVTTVPAPSYAPAPYSPTYVSAPAGTVLTTSNGMTVYVFDRDTPGRSNCYDQCAQYWPPAYAPGGAVASGGLTVIQRADGQTQWATSNGLPLYTYVNDRAPGDTYGNNVDGQWHVVATYSGANNAGYPTTYGSTGYPDVRTVTADGAAVTVQPDSNSAVVTVVNAGAQVRVLDYNGEWSHVEANGQQGFIRTGALR